MNFGELTHTMSANTLWDVRVGRQERFVEGDLHVVPAFLGAPRARVIHQDAAHHARRHRQKMGAVIPSDRLSADQPEIGFVDEGRRLQAVPHAFARQTAPRDAVEFVVDERDQLLEGAVVALTPVVQQRGDPHLWIDRSAILGYPSRCPVDGSSRANLGVERRSCGAESAVGGEVSRSRWP
jgi:hypothetical protein